MSNAEFNDARLRALNRLIRREHEEEIAELEAKHAAELSRVMGVLRELVACEDLRREPYTPEDDEAYRQRHPGALASARAVLASAGGQR